jgi:hypothetical protein
MRQALLLLLIAALAGCSRAGDVFTRRPLLSAKDATGAPKFRSGVWRRTAFGGDGACPFDETHPLTAWPDCAAPQLIALDRMVGFDVVRTPAGRKLTQRSFPYIVGAGLPLLLQRQGEIPRLYSYYAVDQAKLDSQGRIVSARLTRVNCFDPAAATPAATNETDANTLNGVAQNGQVQTPTPKPLPGFSQTSNGDCRPRDLAALRNAAKADAEASSEGVNFRWVRDGDR